MPTQGWVLTEDDVADLVDSVVRSARERGNAVSVAVVEQGGHIVGLRRMDGARLPSTHVSAMKAWTSAMFQRPSGAYGESTAPGGGAFGLWNAFPGYLVPVAGGHPIVVHGACVGGLGVSGGTSEEDDSLAAEAVAAIRARYA
jgi:uncharacterized protein GlcG (DUF336 family)